MQRVVKINEFPLIEIYVWLFPDVCSIQEETYSRGSRVSIWSSPPLKLGKNVALESLIIYIFRKSVLGLDGSNVIASLWIKSKRKRQVLEWFIQQKKNKPVSTYVTLVTSGLVHQAITQAKIPAFKAVWSRFNYLSHSDMLFQSGYTRSVTRCSKNTCFPLHGRFIVERTLSSLAWKACSWQACV